MQNESHFPFDNFLHFFNVFALLFFFFFFIIKGRFGGEEAKKVLIKAWRHS